MRLVLTRPDDLHLHLRDGDALRSVMPHTAERFGRAIVMPNLKPPVTTVDAARAYRDRVLAAVPHDLDFVPMMTLYLTDKTPPEEIARAKESGFIHAVKLYPAGATTNSDSGVTDVRKVEPTLRAMAELKLPLLVHGEVTDPAVDVFDREHAFLERVLMPLLSRVAGLRVVLEHITTKEATAFVFGAGMNVAATITPQHLLMNRNAIFQGGIRPHHYCLPVLKREHHREALLEAAISGSFKFFLGTDSAPHARSAKESACGCAGIYSSHAGIELYAEAFEQAGALNRLDAFASRFGAEFYGLPRNRTTITLEKQPWTVPESYPFGNETIIPLRAGEQVGWRLVA
jgi:dihydroorotase